jgi:hypothetical protein
MARLGMTVKDKLYCGSEYHQVTEEEEEVEEFWNLRSSLDKKTTYLPSFGIGRSDRSGRS